MLDMMTRERAVDTADIVVSVKRRRIEPSLATAGQRGFGDGLDDEGPASERRAAGNVSDRPGLRDP